jgi:hypothetical protein
VGTVTDRQRVWILSLKKSKPAEGQEPALLPEGFSMLVWLAVILLVAWLLGWGVFNVAGGLIHLLLVIAVIVFLINFISGRRTV